MGENRKAALSKKPVDRSEGKSGHHQVVKKNDPLPGTAGKPPDIQAKIGREEDLPPFRASPGLLEKLRCPHNPGKGNRNPLHPVETEGEGVREGEITADEAFLGRGNGKENPGPERQKTGPESPVEQDLHGSPVASVLRQTKEPPRRTGIGVDKTDLPVVPDNFSSGVTPHGIFLADPAKIPGSRRGATSQADS